MIKYVVLIISFTLVSCSTLPPVAYLDVIESSYRAIAGYPDKKNNGIILQRSKI